MNTTAKLKRIRSIIWKHNNVAIISNNDSDLYNILHDIIDEFNSLDDDLKHGGALPEDWE